MRGKHYSTITSGMLGIDIKADQGLLSWLSREPKETCPGRDTLAKNCNDQAEQSQSHGQPTQTRFHQCIASFSPLALSSLGELYNPSISPYSSTLTAVIAEELSTEHWAHVPRTESSKSDVITTFSSILVLVKIS